MKKCYCCNKSLKDSNKSEEHIIPNVFGGKLKSKDILCKKCNAILGSDIDKRFCNNFEYLNILLGPKRERKTNGGFVEADVSGTRIKLFNGFEYSSSPKIYEIFDGKNKIINGEIITSPDNIKAQNFFLKNFYDKIKKNNYNGSIEDLKSSIVKTKYDSDYIHIAPNNDLLDVLFGYLKIAIGFCAYHNKIDLVDKELISIFIERVQKKESIEKKEVRDNFFNILSKKIFFINQKYFHDGRICNRISLSGDKENKKLYIIIGIYDAFHFLIILNDDYCFDNFQEKYIYDVINNKKIDYTFPKYNTILEDYLTFDDLYQAVFKNTANNISYVMSFKTISLDYSFIGDLFLKFIEYIIKTNNNKLDDVTFKEKFINDFSKLRIDNEKLRFLSDDCLKNFAEICYKQYSDVYNKFILHINLCYQDFIKNDKTLSCFALDNNILSKDIILEFIHRFFQDNIKDEWSELFDK
nr:HNH endonuclease [uncultured Campylobacter sp.]